MIGKLLNDIKSVNSHNLCRSKTKLRREGEVNFGEVWGLKLMGMGKGKRDRKGDSINKWSFVEVCEFKDYICKSDEKKWNVWSIMIFYAPRM